MRRLSSRSEVTMPSSPSATTRAFASVDLTQMSARRRSRLEARSCTRGRVVGVIHREDVLVREPPGLCRPDALDEIAPAIEGPEPRRSEQVLEDPCAEKVDAELGDVDRQRADRLERVEQDERAAIVSKLDDRRDVQHCAVAVTDMGDRDDERVVVDRTLEVLERDRAVVSCEDV